MKWSRNVDRKAINVDVISKSCYAATTSPSTSRSEWRAARQQDAELECIVIGCYIRHGIGVVYFEDSHGHTDKATIQISSHNR